eukprot:COSAG02_NODE_18_length_54986_cov_345.599322_10_plen_148_part_00
MTQGGHSQRTNLRATPQVAAGLTTAVAAVVECPQCCENRLNLCLRVAARIQLAFGRARRVDFRRANQRTQLGLAWISVKVYQHRHASRRGNLVERSVYRTSTGVHGGDAGSIFESIIVLTRNIWRNMRNERAGVEGASYKKKSVCQE